MDKCNWKSAIKFTLLGFIILILFVLLCNTSYGLISDSFSEQIKINEKTSRYLSFNYAENNSYVFKNNSLKVVDDVKGKRLSGNNVFDFSVLVPEKNVDKDLVEYEIIVILLGSSLDEKYIKFYMTDRDDIALDGFEGAVPNFCSFPDSTIGKVVYTGVLSKDKPRDQYKVRVWISDKYESRDKVKSLNLRILVRLKNK